MGGMACPSGCTSKIKCWGWSITRSPTHQRMRFNHQVPPTTRLGGPAGCITAVCVGGGASLGAPPTIKSPPTTGFQAGLAGCQRSTSTTTSRASEINKFMSLLSMALPIENLSIITFDSWLSRGRG